MISFTLLELNPFDLYPLILKYTLILLYCLVSIDNDRNNMVGPIAGGVVVFIVAVAVVAALMVVLYLR